MTCLIVMLFLCFMVELFFMSRFCPEVYLQLPFLISFLLTENKKPLIDKWCPFHIPSHFASLLILIYE